MFGNKPHTRIDDVVRSVIQANHNAACREAAHPCGELIAVFSRHFASAGESFSGITMYTEKRSFANVATRTHLFFATRQFVSHFAKWRSVRAHPAIWGWKFQNASPPTSSDVFVWCWPNFMRILATMINSLSLFLAIGWVLKVLWHFKILTWESMGNLKCGISWKQLIVEWRGQKFGDSGYFSVHM